MIKKGHNNQIIQNSFNKYGIENFKFSLVEQVEDDDILTDKEKYWANHYDVFNLKKGFNICPIEVNQANSTGNTEHADKVRGMNNGKAKLTDNDVIEICEVLNEREEGKSITLTKIGEIYGVSSNAITSIRTGRTRGNVSSKYLSKKITDKWNDKRKERWLKSS